MAIKKTDGERGAGAAGWVEPKRTSEESSSADRDYIKLLNLDRDVNAAAWVLAGKVKIEDPDKAQRFLELLQKAYPKTTEAEEKRIREEQPSLERHRTLVFAVPKGDRTPKAPSVHVIRKAEQIDATVASRLKAQVDAERGRKGLKGRATVGPASGEAERTGRLRPQGLSETSTKRKRG